MHFYSLVMFLDMFRIRVRIFCRLVWRFFSPWDRFFLNSIVFDIWKLACNGEILGEIAERTPRAPVNDSEMEELLLDEDEAGDAELVTTLAQARQGVSRARLSMVNGLDSQTRVNKVKFTPRSVSYL